ncbi:MAG: hypothetical protein IPM79_00870 [Polyangiaceae bacterium]|jgi:hypothetical protein|nr:hypothetical protein [Polyangiaceae bacterium]MBK8936230.1 hypothetical protein [Polyangiaceae bacterium]
MSPSIPSVTALFLSLSLATFGAGCVSEETFEEDLEEAAELEAELNEGPGDEVNASDPAPNAIQTPDWHRHDLRGQGLCAAAPRLTASQMGTVKKPHVSERESTRRPSGPGPFVKGGSDLSALSATVDRAGELLQQTHEAAGDVVPYSLDAETCEQLPGHIWNGGECVVPCAIES